MALYGENGGFSEENHGTVYHAGNGFYNPYVEPFWKTEKRKIRASGNGIGLAALGYVAISLMASLVFTVFVQFFYPAANIHGLYYVTETTEWLFNLGIYIFSLVVPFGIYSLCIKMPLKVALPFRKAKMDLTIGGIFICLGATVLASYAVSFLQLGLEAVGIGITMPEYEVPETVPGIILYIVNLTLAPAFIEEMVFRGAVMQSLRRFGDIFAIVASALIFGIFHLNLIQMPYAFILGLCIGYFVMRTGSLWVGIIVHFINNSIAVAFEFAYPYMTEDVYYFANSLYNLICVILSVVAIIFVLMKYRDIFRFEPSRNILSPGKRTLYFITAPALILAMAAAVIMTLPYIHFI